MSQQVCPFGGEQVSLGEGDEQVGIRVIGWGGPQATFHDFGKLIHSFCRP
jgi:hypothetical protein